MSCIASIEKECNRAHQRLDAHLQAIRTEARAIAALLATAPQESPQVEADPSLGGRPTRCLMCNQPYGSVGGKLPGNCQEMNARCKCPGYGWQCARGATQGDADTFLSGPPCCMFPSRVDCYACRLRTAAAE